MASKAQTKIDRYKKKAAAAYAEKQAAIRTVLDAVEVCAGAAASGYAAQKVGPIMGVPVDAAAGIAGMTAAYFMDQPDLYALSLGMSAGYFRSVGENLGANPSKVIDFEGAFVAR